MSENRSFWNFVDSHRDEDPASLRLVYGRRDMGYDVESAVTQIEARRKAAGKIPSFLSRCPEFMFPTVLSAEQATAEAVALYHASLVPPGSVIVDMTAGLGIDAMTMARKARHVTAIDINPAAAKALAHNASLLGIHNLTAVTADSATMVLHGDSVPAAARPDMYFIDPARRSGSGWRLFRLSDCLPDVTLIAPELIGNGGRLMVKASPMLDITNTISELPCVHAIHIVDYRNECKELLIECRMPGDARWCREDIRVLAADISADTSVSTLEFSLTDINRQPDMFIPSDYDYAGSYLYEPSPALMKAGAWQSLCSVAAVRSGVRLHKLARDTHLFVSSEYPGDLPGRVFRVDSVLSRSDLKRLKKVPLSIMSRNHPITADDLRKRLRSAESPADFLLATTVGDSRKPLYLRLTKIR